MAAKKAGDRKDRFDCIWIARTSTREEFAHDDGLNREVPSQPVGQKSTKDHDQAHDQIR
jgi:hypothetical protein